MDLLPLPPVAKEEEESSEEQGDEEHGDEQHEDEEKGDEEEGDEEKGDEEKGDEEKRDEEGDEGKGDEEKEDEEHEDEEQGDEEKEDEEQEDEEQGGQEQRDEEQEDEEQEDEEQEDEDGDEEQEDEGDGPRGQDAGKVQGQMVAVKKEQTGFAAAVAATSAQASGAVQPSPVRNSTTHKAAYDKFSREIRNGDVFPAQLAPMLKKTKKSDLFGLWLDCQEQWDRVVLEVERHQSKKNLARDEWIAIQAKDLRKKLSQEKFDEIISKRLAAGLVYDDSDFPQDAEERWIYMPRGKLVRKDQETGETMIFFVSCALVSLSLSVTGKKRRKTKRG